MGLNNPLGAGGGGVGTAYPLINTISASSYGVVGNGVADDTTAMQNAFNALIAQGQAGNACRLIVPGGTYKVTSGLTLAATANIGVPLCIDGYGAKIQSAITNNADVVKLSATTGTVLWRYFTILGLQISGNNGKGGGVQHDGHCLHVSCENSANAMYNFSIRDVTCQQAGLSGMALTGAVFECTVADCFSSDNLVNGCLLDNGSSGGILSAIHIRGCSFSQNVQYGLATGAAPDINLHQSYFRTNGLNGAVFGQGFKSIDQCGFEQNCTGGSAAPPNGDGGAGWNQYGFRGDTQQCLVIATGCNNVGNQLKMFNMNIISAGQTMHVIDCITAGAQSTGLGNITGLAGGTKVHAVGNSGAITYSNIVPENILAF